MAHSLATELRDIAEGLRRRAARGADAMIAGPLTRIDAAIATLAKSWSGSNIGYHSRIYYSGFQPPPPGQHFDSFHGASHNSTRRWVEQHTDHVTEHLYRLARVEGLGEQVAAARHARQSLSHARSEVDSVLRTYLAHRHDALVTDLVHATSQIHYLTMNMAIVSIVGTPGKRVTLDPTAVNQGLRAAPHQQMQARVISIRSVFVACRDLANIAIRAASHIDRLETSHSSKGRGVAVSGTRVFIGHGRSRLWLELKDFINDRMQLPWDEFNRVPVAGMTNIARLSDMLDDAGIAFVVLTAEDQTTDGMERARQNAVHEAGLFQGRLGFSRALVVLEDGCEEFTNIAGLNQIRFPAGHISACFEAVRLVLARIVQEAA